MRRSCYRIVFVLCIVSLTGLVAFWVFPQYFWNGVVLFGRTVSTILFPVTALLLFVNRKPFEGAPDFLGAMGLKIYERDGLCFAVEPVVENEKFFIQLWYQSNYAHYLDVSLIIRPEKPPFRRNFPFVPIIEEFVAAPGAFGVISCHIPVARNWVGKSFYMVPAATVECSGEKRGLLRLTSGVTVNSFSGNREKLFSFLAFIGGVWIFQSKPGRFKLKLPLNAQDGIMDPSRNELIWAIGDEFPQGVKTVY